PAHRGRVLQRQRPAAPLRHRGGHARRRRAGRPGGAAGQPAPAAGGRGAGGPRGGLREDEGRRAPGEESVEAIVAALYGFLARTPSMLLAATLEDAVEAHQRPNVPGTIDQGPNWALPPPR